MGWLDVLTQVGGAAAKAYGNKGAAQPAAAKAGTDWASLLGAGARAAGDFGTVAGAQSAGAAAGRAKESALLDDRDRTAIAAQQANQSGQNSVANTDLERKKFLQTSRLTNAQQALMGDVFSHYTPTDINTPGIPHSTISGGLTMGQGGKDAMTELLKQARLAQLTPEQFQGGGLAAAPTLSGVPQESGMDSFLGTAGKVGTLAGSLAPTLAELLKKQPQQSAAAVPVETLAGLEPPDPRKPQTYNPNAYKANF